MLHIAYANKDVAKYVEWWYINQYRKIMPKCMENESWKAEFHVSMTEFEDEN